MRKLRNKNKTVDSQKIFQIILKGFRWKLQKAHTSFVLCVTDACIGSLSLLLMIQNITSMLKDFVMKTLIVTMVANTFVCVILS